MNFDDAYQQSGLKQALSDAGRQVLTAAPADLALQIGGEEQIAPAELLFTHLCEHGFELTPSLPNANQSPQETSHWDVGPYQTNIFWGRRVMSLIKVDPRFRDRKELIEAATFGVTFFTIDPASITPQTTKFKFSSAPILIPCPFSGVPAENARLAARWLLTIPGPARERVVRYTSEPHRQKRAELWDALGRYFTAFFAAYRGS